MGMRNVEVSDKDGKVLFVYPISVADISGRNPVDLDYFDIAVSNAVADGLANQDEVKGLKLRFVD